MSIVAVVGDCTTTTALALAAGVNTTINLHRCTSDRQCSRWAPPMAIKMNN